MTKIDGYQAYAINWTESERGYGQRPDGYSLHVSKEAGQNFKKEHGIEGNAEVYSFAEWLIFRVIVNEETWVYLNNLLKSGIHGNRYSFPRKLEPGQVVTLE